MKIELNKKAQFGRNMTTVFQRAFCLLLSLSLASACNSESDGNYNDQNIVNVYNWADYIALPVIDKFEAEYGVKVNYDVYDAAAIVDVKLLTGNSGYDVVVHSNQFSSRLIDIDVFQELDTEQLPNLANLDPDTMAAIDIYEKVRGYNSPYHWGSTGIAYNVDMIRERLPNQSMDTSAVLFDPEIVSKLADCGVSFLDGTTSLIPMALAYLGLDPNSIDDESLALVEAQLKKVRPYVRYFSNDKFLSDMPNKEICIAMTWSGDYAASSQRALDAGIDIQLKYAVPREGAPLWVDGIYIPSDAPHPDNAHKFLNFLLRADIAAEIADDVLYANPNKASWALMKQSSLDDPAIYPDAEVWSRLFAVDAADPVRERARTRTLARIKSGL